MSFTYQINHKVNSSKINVKTYIEYILDRIII